MIVVDSSAIFAILLGEPEENLFLDILLEAKAAVIGAPTLVECRIVAHRRSGADWNTRLDSILGRLRLAIVPFDKDHEIIAAEAFRRFGRGLNNAGLNFGDCLSYAIAKARNEPLLFKGSDFRRTDISAAI